VTKPLISDYDLGRIEALMLKTKVPGWHPSSSDDDYDDEPNTRLRQVFRHNNNYLRMLDLLDYMPLLVKEVRRQRGEEVEP
jgi:hypothetical protein